MDPAAILAGAAIVVGLTITLGTLYAIFRMQVKKTDMELLQASNKELREQRAEQKTEIDELRGRVQALQSSMAQDLATALKNEIRNLVVELRNQP